MTFKDLLHRLKFKYHVVVVNEETLTERINFHLSWLALINIVGLIMLATFAIVSCLIFMTPIKNYLPGVADAGVREEIIQQAATIDSLSRLVEHNEQQLYYIKCVIAGEVPVDSVSVSEDGDSVVTFNSSNIDLSPTAREKAFVEKYSKQDEE